MFFAIVLQGKLHKFFCIAIVMKPHSHATTGEFGHHSSHLRDALTAEIRRIYG